MFSTIPDIRMVNLRLTLPNTRFSHKTCFCDFLTFSLISIYPPFLLLSQLFPPSFVLLLFGLFVSEPSSTLGPQLYDPGHFTISRYNIRYMSNLDAKQLREVCTSDSQLTICYRNHILLCTNVSASEKSWLPCGGLCMSAYSSIRSKGD